MLETDQEQPPEAGRELGAFVVRGIVRMDFDHAIDTLSYPTSELARRDLALP